jgi:hypothetical protein
MKIQKLLFFLLAGLALSAWADDTKKPIDSLLGKCPEGSYYLATHNECAPILSHPEPIDGVSQEDLIKIEDAHRDELYLIKGVVSMGIDWHGMYVEVLPDHGPIPSTLEGISLHTHPYVYEVLIGADFPSK